MNWRSYDSPGHVMELTALPKFLSSIRSFISARGGREGSGC